MSFFRLFACLLLLTCGVGPALGQSVRFPADAVINILDYEPNANDGVMDATAAIQQAIDEHGIDFFRRFTLYFPAGTYRVSAPVFADAYNEDGQGGTGKSFVLQGEGRDFTTIKLTDSNPLFQNTAAPLPVVSTAGGNTQEGWTNVAFMTSVFDLTIDVGSGNPGAIGLRYIANNQGAVKNVRIRSSDPEGVGWAAIDMERASIPGPALLTRVETIGFDYGIRVGGPNYGTTIEHLHIRDAVRGGIRNDRHILSIRGLRTEGIDGPAIENLHPDGLLTIIDSELNGPAGYAAIVNNGYLFARNIEVGGYGYALNDHGELKSGSIEEERYGQLIKLWEESPDTSLNLPIVEHPEAAYDPPETWVNVADFGYEPGSASAPNYNDAGPAIQAAIDFMNEPGNEERTTLYFQPGDYRLGSPLQLYGNVKRVVGNFATIWPRPEIEKTTEPIFTIADTDYELLIIERINVGPACCGDRRRMNSVFYNNSSKDVVLQHVYIGHGKAYEKGTATGRLFLQDVSALSQYYYVHTHREEVLPEAVPQFDLKDQRVWARQFNPEQRHTKVSSVGGQVWILGLKTEEPGIVVLARDTARVEVLGGTILPSFEVIDSTPMIKIENAQASFVLAEHAGFNNFSGGGYYKRLIEESRAGDHRQLDRGESPQRLQGQGTPVSVLPLYVAHGGPRFDPSYLIELSGMLAYDSVIVGQNRRDTFTIHNAGNSTLEVQAIVYPTGFTGPTGSFSLPAGTQREVIITFSPTELTTYEGYVRAFSNAESSVDSLFVTGTAAPSRVVRLSGVLVFPETVIGQTSEKTLTVANDGLGTLAVADIILPAGFTADTSAFSVTPDSNVGVVIRFAPTEALPYNGLVEVQSDATSGNAILNIAGRGLLSSPTRKSPFGGELHISPNPIAGPFILTLENDLNGRYELKVSNLAGQTILRTHRSKRGRRVDWPIELPPCPPGTYVLRIIRDGTEATTRFVQKI